MSFFLFYLVFCVLTLLVYSHMSVLVDQVFPPAQCEPSDEFSQSVYWREPLPDVRFELPPAPQPHVTLR